MSMTSHPPRLPGGPEARDAFAARYLGGSHPSVSSVRLRYKPTEDGKLEPWLLVGILYNDEQYYDRLAGVVCDNCYETACDCFSGEEEEDLPREIEGVRVSYRYARRRARHLVHKVE